MTTTSIAVGAEGAVEHYLAEVMVGLALPRGTAGGHVGANGRGDPEAIFDLLTSREFCYLGRTKAAPYRESTVELLQRRMMKGEPLRLFYDIGPGYHATLRPEILPMRFDVGLSELLILSQVAAVCRRVSEVYPPGARYWLVIDNICGLRTNDIPLELTEQYCARLRALIGEVAVGDCVDLVVESEEFDLEEYDALLAELAPSAPDPDPSPAAVANVQRFLGRSCSVEEASERIERYRRTGTVTDALIDRLVRGVHMTQRATGATLGFRPFPGGDSRTQCGEVALIYGSSGRLRPVMLTSRNVHEFECVDVEAPGTLPPSIRSVIFASSLSAPEIGRVA